MRDQDQKILLVGAGAAGRTHLRALEEIPSLTVVGVVDPNVHGVVTFRGKNVPLHPSILDASGACEPCVIVIATPTPTHSELCREAARLLPQAVILVEKPAADKLSDAQWLLNGVAGRQPVKVAFHMAFAPEVIWGSKLTIAGASELGDPDSIESWSADPYQAHLDSARARLGDSWIDSGINSLSVIERFVRVADRISFRKLGDESWSAFEGRFRCEAGSSHLEATVLTSWHVTDATRSTRIRYSSGAELVLDHHAVAGYLALRGAVTDIFGSDGVVPRRDTHYRALYRSWLMDKRPMFPDEATLRLHSLLLKPMDGT